MTDATYRELMDGAFTAAGRASFAMLRHHFADKARAGSAVAAYRDVLDAVRADMQYVITLTRTAGDKRQAAEPPAAPAGSLLAKTAEILTARARRSAAGDPSTLSEPARYWRQAATYLRAAHDLLDTHRTPDFGWRTPDARLLDDARPQAAAIDSLAGLLRVVAGSGQVLALRAREVDRNIECVDILDPAPLRLVAASLTDYSRGADAIPAFDELTAARTTSRRPTTAQPLGAAVQAMAELRQGAWEHARSPHLSISAIRIYAVLAITVHQHAAAIESALATRLPASAAADEGAFGAERYGRSSRLSAEAAGAWRRVHKLCAGLQTPSPAPAVTYQQILAVRTDLEAVTRTGANWRRVADIVPDAAAAALLATQLRRLVRPLEEISGWHLPAVRDLARAGQLYAPASALGRDELSNDPRLAAARLARRPVPLPQSHASKLVNAFTAADRATWAAVKANCDTGTLGGPARPGLFRMRTTHRTAGSAVIGL